MSERKYIGPQNLRPGRVVVQRDDARRVDRIVMRLGLREASARLGVGETTIVIAIEQGTLLQSTRDRLLDAVSRVEAALAGASCS